MLRLYDWECTLCGTVHEELVEGGERRSRCECPDCRTTTMHERCFPKPAAYMGEKVYNPMVAGGAFDTTGQARLPELPKLPHGVERTSDNLRQLHATKEYKHAQSERKRISEQNRAKRKRAALIKQGANINMRRDKLPGDPDITG